jgi:glycosyltransferase involved in cell wall biosynthesis
LRSDTLTTADRKRPKVSVITVCFNDAKNLQATIASVIGQSYSNVEFIIVDGGSSDSTLDVIRVQEARITKWVSEKDAGIYDAMNKGLRLATGDYLIFMNAGDAFHSDDIVESAMDRIASEPEKPLIAYGRAAIFGEDGAFLKDLAPLRFVKRNLNMFGTRTVCHQSIFVARTTAPEYDTEFRLKAELDWYYRLVGKTRDDQRLELDLTVADYRLGGKGDKGWKANELERIRVTRKNNRRLTFIALAPFFALPLAFRLKLAARQAFLHARGA